VLMSDAVSLTSTAAAQPSGSAANSLADPRRASWLVLAIFLAPALAVYVGLTAYPAFRTIHDSFFTIEGMEQTFVGLANYRELV
ncbi:sugar ABC transporter permease, partial [Streptococcus pneumoniae]|uniref:sugar ABC transporter permease n=1 Tax=Streptococcus pneumoniae TaxID=1313 RepID=UPI001952EB97